MAASTGPDQNTYQIPEVELADTFNVWRDTTNTTVYKLNKLRVYDGVSSGSIEMSVAGGGTLSAELATNINKGVTFVQPVNFMSGVTFDGDVTFNASRFTVNANLVTIDDYNIVLGDTAGTSDDTISTAGGGGLLLKRGGSGNTAEWLWKATQQHGITGTWTSNSHIGFDGSDLGLRAHSGSVLPVYAQSLALSPGTETAHPSLSLNYRSGTGLGSTAAFEFVRNSSSSAGGTAFIEVLNGSTYGGYPFVNIPNGANRKIITQSGLAPYFGMVLRMNGSSYAKAIATDSSNAEVIGIISRVINSSTFEITMLGEIYGDFRNCTENGANLIPGATYYLSPFAEGKITATQPTGAGFVHKAVLIATGTNSAIVLPFTGGVLAAPLNITNASSVAMRIEQINRFKRGDIVRFQSFTPGTTLTYRANRTANTGDIIYQQYYPNGIYVLADARNGTEGEVAGMVVDLYGASGAANNEAYSGFDILMDGWFSTGISGTIQPGTVYWLRANYRGTTQAYENDAQTSFDTGIPQLQGQLQKPLFMATSSQSGYLYSYRGNVASGGVGVSFAALNEFLVQDIRGTCAGDLRIGVFNGTVGGYEAIRIASGYRAPPDPRQDTQGVTTGYVGIGGGWNRWASGSARKIMYPLDVNGPIRAGYDTNGGELLSARWSNDEQSGTTASVMAVIGTERGTGNLVLGRGVRPRRDAAGYVSSITGTVDRSALVLGEIGGVPSLSWSIAEGSEVNRDNPVTLSEVFSVRDRTVRFRGGDSSNPSTGYLGTPINIDILNDQYVAQNSSPVIRQTFTPIGNWGGSYSLWLGRVFGGGTQLGSLKAITSRVYDDSSSRGAASQYTDVNAHTSLNVMSDYASPQAVLYIGSGSWSGNTRRSLYTEQGAILGASAGSVGIGTTSPVSTVKLDVNGLVRSNVTPEQITNAKHLTTKEYVDGLGRLGVGQVWTVFDKSATGRTAGGVYQNTTGKPIMVKVVGPTVTTRNVYSTIEAYVGTSSNAVNTLIDRNGISTAVGTSAVSQLPSGTSINASVTLIVPPNNYYRVSLLSNNSTLTTSTAHTQWTELR